MPSLRDRRRLLLVAILAAGSLTCLRGQTSQPAPPSVSPDSAFLARVSSLYYSSAKSGLSGFDCSAHPDWRGLFLAVRSGGSLSSEDETRIALLNGVAITVHARLNTRSTLDWTPAPGAASDADSTNLLDQEHAAIEQTLMGFMQFWTPFMNGSVIPAAASGITVTHTPSTFNLHSEQSGATVDEVFSNDLLLLEYDVIAGGNVVKFEPTYKATPQGLLVERFRIHIQQASPQSGPAQELHAVIEYRTLKGFPIPARLNLELSGTAILNFVLDGCQVNPQTDGPAL